MAVKKHYVLWLLTAMLSAMASCANNNGSSVADVSGPDKADTDSASAVEDTSDVNEDADGQPTGDTDGGATDSAVASPLKCGDPKNSLACDSKGAICVPADPGKDATCECREGLSGNPYKEGGCDTNILECTVGLDKCDKATTECVEANPLENPASGGDPYLCKCLTKKGFSVRITPDTCACPVSKVVKDGGCVCKPGSIADGSGNCKPCAAGCAADAECGLDGCGISCGDCDAIATCDAGICICPTGHTKDIATGTCLLNNVCGTPSQKFPCDPNATCIPGTPGENTCKCKEGYNQEGNNCIFIPTCAVDNGQCPPSSDCVEIPWTGEMKCLCKKGYLGSNNSCVNINECQPGSNPCDPAANCTDLPGSFGCACKAGWSGDGFQCTEVNECKVSLDDCDAHATCTNTPGGYLCACKSGYTGDGKTCVDIDECSASPGICGSAVCANVPGSYDCGCGAGLKGLPPDCQDIDECALGIDDCDYNAVCDNFLGGYQCKCGVGFEGDGFTCTDRLECQIDKGGCHAQAICVEQFGAPPKCLCVAGWDGSGILCYPQGIDVLSIGYVLAPKPTTKDCWDEDKTGACPKIDPGTVQTIANAMAQIALLWQQGKVDESLWSKYDGTVLDTLTALTKVVDPPDPVGKFGLTTALSGPYLSVGTPAAEGTFHHAILWEKSWYNAPIEDDMALTLELVDSDPMALTDDVIGAVAIGKAEILQLLENEYCDFATCLVPTHTQGAGHILGMLVTIRRSDSCGDGFCTTHENQAQCPQDCDGFICGNGVCEAVESSVNCPWDCIICGNKICQAGEGSSTCPSDCPLYGQCQKAATIACGETVFGTTHGSGSTKAEDTWYASCDTWQGPFESMVGNEYTYYMTPTCDGVAKVTLTKKNLTVPPVIGLFVTSASTPCTSSLCLQGGVVDDNGVLEMEIPITGGKPINLTVDSTTKVTQNYQLAVTCGCQ